MKTAVCSQLGIDVPIIQAPMEGAVGPKLAAAVSNAGGLGMLAPWASDVETLRRQVRETRALTDKPFAVNLNPEFPQGERLEASLEEGVPIISFFWRDPAGLIDKAKAAGATVMHTVANARDARAAVDRGVDVIVAQGWEAGGHVRGTVATLPLVPSVVDAVAPVPVIAAGGIADGRGLAAALALGASGAWIGTRLLASEEAHPHPEYLERVFAASEDDTIHLDDLFHISWPDAPHRVLRASTTEAWEDAGRPPIGERPGEGEAVGTSKAHGPVLRYQSDTPGQDMDGDIAAMAMYAGQSAGLVKKRQPAGDIIREITEQAQAVLKSLAV